MKPLAIMWIYLLRGFTQKEYHIVNNANVFISGKPLYIQMFMNIDTMGGCIYILFICRKLVGRKLVGRKLVGRKLVGRKLVGRKLVGRKLVGRK